jgi:hypothetical protein
MARRILAAACLVVVTVVGGLIPGMTQSVAAASCSSWTSESTPPPTVRVFRHASGGVERVDFKTYAKNVLSREWIGSWTTESLRSGAMAVRNYAWYQVLHWRGGVNAAGACFDLRDDTQDQVYDPSKATWSTAAAAVDATWAWLVTKAGHIFPTYYNAGTSGESCGANANGWKAYQWGTQACGLAGKTAPQIIVTYYYPGVSVSGAAGTSPSPTPTPKPTPTPAPTATPTPAASHTATPSPSSSAAPPATPTPRPTATPTPRPAATPTPRPAATPTPLPAPPTNQELPGGGQSTVTQRSAPPPPPPAHPKPVVATRVLAPIAVWGVIASNGEDVAVSVESASGTIATGANLAALTSGLDPPADSRLAQLRALVSQLGSSMLRAIVSELAAHHTFAALSLR